MHSAHPATGLGYVARLRFQGPGPPSLSVCPHRTAGLEPAPLAGEAGGAALLALFFAQLRSASAPLGGLTVGDPDGLGCAGVSEAGDTGREAR